MLQNTPKKYVDDKNVNELREQYENRGLWFYKIIEKALENGLDYDFARKAIFNAGIWNGLNKFPRTDDMKEFADAFMTVGVEKANEGEIVELTDDKLIVDVGYCPLVTAWRKFTDDEEKIALLCDIAMEVDRGIMSTFGWELELKGTIGTGFDKCRLCFIKNRV